MVHQKYIFYYICVSAYSSYMTGLISEILTDKFIKFVWPFFFFLEYI